MGSLADDENHIQEGCWPLSKWIMMLPVIQGALNKAQRRKLGTSSFLEMMDRKLRTGFSVLVEDSENLQLSSVDGRTM